MADRCSYPRLNLILPSDESFIPNEQQSPSPPPPSSLPAPLPSRAQLVNAILPVCIKLKLAVNALDDAARDIDAFHIMKEDALELISVKLAGTVATLDTELKDVAAWLTENIDRARISDPNLQLLFDFNKYIKEMSRVVGDMAEIALPDLETVITQRRRGFLDARPFHVTLHSLKQMRVGMQRAANLVQSRSHA